MRWIPADLHCHTLHSDGGMTVLELAQKAKELHLEAIALTDHNTISGHAQIETVSKETGICIIPGMEWTTFHGHMLTLGVDRYIDWRYKGVSNIQEGIQEVRQSGGICGVAHPFAFGTPVCTGCHWEFIVKDWHEVNYIEVWNGAFPLEKGLQRSENSSNYEFWKWKLGEGYRIHAVAGTDWHGSGSGYGCVRTYIGLYPDEELNAANLVSSLQRGTMAVALGPLVTISAVSATDETTTVEMGGVIQADKVMLTVHVQQTNRVGQWDLEDDCLHVKVLIDNTEIMTYDISAETLAGEGNKKNIEISTVTAKWVLTEVYGTVLGEETLLSFTNPIFVKNTKKIK